MEQLHDSKNGYNTEPVLSVVVLTSVAGPLTSVFPFLISRFLDLYLMVTVVVLGHLVIAAIVYNNQQANNSVSPALKC